ncbi:MAG: VRR-NUC domain-containing protein [Ktedonobacteraceae bacterium]
MSKLESTVKAEILQAFGSAPNITLFKNDQGQAWLKSPIGFRPYRYGLGAGTSDLVGWQTIVITPSMVGKKIARFLAAELKAQGGKATPEQIAFIRTVMNAGGIGFIARSVQEFESSLALFDEDE